MSDWKTPPVHILVRLASIVVHMDEYLSVYGTDFDLAAAKAVLIEPDLREWLESIPSVMLPEKRQ